MSDKLQLSSFFAVERIGIRDKLKFVGHLMSDIRLSFRSPLSRMLSSSPRHHRRVRALL